MPFVKLYYGPYRKNGIIRHKTQRLRSIIGCLTKLGYETELVPSSHLDRVTVEMKGREIFRCSIIHLLFNEDCEEDPVCQKLVKAVKEAEERLYSKDNTPNFCCVTKGKGIIEEVKNGKTTQDRFSSNIKLFEIPKQLTEKKKLANITDSSPKR